MSREFCTTTSNSSTIFNYVDTTSKYIDSPKKDPMLIYDLISYENIDTFMICRKMFDYHFESIAMKKLEISDLSFGEYIFDEINRYSFKYIGAASDLYSRLYPLDAEAIQIDSLESLKQYFADFSPIYSDPSKQTHDFYHCEMNPFVQNDIECIKYINELDLHLSSKTEPEKEINWERYQFLECTINVSIIKNREILRYLHDLNHSMFFDPSDYKFLMFNAYVNDNLELFMHLIEESNIKCTIDHLHESLKTDILDSYRISFYLMNVLNIKPDSACLMDAMENGKYRVVKEMIVNHGKRITSKVIKMAFKTPDMVNFLIHQCGSKNYALTQIQNYKHKTSTIDSDFYH